jgi:hypothetical protein
MDIVDTNSINRKDMILIKGRESERSVLPAFIISLRCGFGQSEIL